MSDVDNNGKARRVGGVTGAGFLPGQNDNPGGRPKALRRSRETSAEVRPGSPELRWPLKGFIDSEWGTAAPRTGGVLGNGRPRGGC
jgi:hypothetical protein